MVLLMFHPVAGVAAVSTRRRADCQACYRNRVVLLAKSPQACSHDLRSLGSKRNPTYQWPSALSFIRFMGSAAICTNFLLNAQKKRKWHLHISTGTQRLRIKATSVMEQGTWLQTWEEESQNFGTGPLSGDLAEIEAFCRIHRIAEQLHKAVMDSLCSLGRDETTNVRTGGFSSSLEEKVAAGLACIGATLQQGRLEILGAWAKDPDEEDEKLPRVTRFRSKLRSCCKSLQTSLQSLLAAKGEQNLAVYRILQRFNNICLDAGFPRPDGVPCHDHIPNFATVKLRSLKEQNDEPVDFWRGGQLTEEGLEWLLDNKFKTIVDLRAEDPENGLGESALMEAEASGKIKRVKIPVQVETAPTMQQVQEFARLVSDSTNRPLFLHSYAGIVRTSAMISRWREFVSRGGLEAEDTDSTVLTQKREFKELRSCESADSKDPILDHNLLEPSTSALEPSHETNVTRTQSPFQAQMPGPNVFSRKAMSTFFRQKRTTPSTFLTRLKKRVVLKSSSSNGSVASSGQPNGQVEETNAESNELGRSSSDSSYGQAKGINNGGLTEASSGDDHPVVEGDMCASKTGVVRLQSRKKAEMYLVRTDGFSCTREKVMESTLAFTHPSTQQQMLMWKTAPKTVLLLKKLGDELMEEAKQVASFLYHQEGMNVMVEPDVHDRFARYPGFGYVQTFYNHDIGELHERVDFVVCLGGDGVILHASNLFRSSVPPVVSFNLGSLGFLTAHPFEDFKQDLRAIIHGNRRIEGVYVTLRMRLRCEIFRDGQPIPGKVFEVLNEVVVDRGSNPYLCKIECYERNRLITKVQADGVLVATPTGSTAYSTAAGGSMVHPNVPCMLFTPICPHSLSFRPVILPDSAILELKVPNNSRSNAWVSFDGKKRQQLSKGDSVQIYMCQNPVPTVNKSDHTSDWFRSLDRCFNWSDRKEQKPLPMVPEDARSSAFVSFDGKRKQPLKKGESIRVCMSEHPMSTVNKRDQTDDWFSSLSRCFGWNQRAEQKLMSVP